MLTSPSGLFWWDVKTTLILERKHLAFFRPRPPCAHLSTGKRCVSRQGTLRTGHPRLRPAVTHCYSEMVTSGASLPFILEWNLHGEVPFSLAWQPQRKFPKEQLGECSGQGPGETEN